MKTIHKHFLALALLALTANTAQARSWRIHHEITKSPDFTSINAAMASEEVLDGDILYMDPGCMLSTSQTISKQVTVVGCGYFRTIPTKETAIVAATYITAPNVKIEGMVFGGNVYVRANNVTLERCKTDYTINIGTSSLTAQDATIRQCYAFRINGAGPTSLNSAYCTIENCILLVGVQGGVVTNLYFATIKNCYLKQSYANTLSYAQIFGSLSHHTVVNCIFFPYSNQIWYGCSSEELVQNNVTISKETSAFAGGANDLYYQLKDDSPAKGAGIDGVDCGPYGGPTPYVPCGLPAYHPYYTKAAISPRSENDKVKVSLQIKMQNE